MDKKELVVQLLVALFIGLLLTLTYTTQQAHADPIRDEFLFLNKNRYQFTRPTGEITKTITGQVDIKHPEQVNVVNKQLVLTQAPTNEAYVNDFGTAKTYYYKSGWIQTWDKFAFRYGRISVKYKPAPGVGLISALYLLPQTQTVTSKEKWPPEIDIETDGGPGDNSIAGSNTYFTLHYADSAGVHKQDGIHTTTHGGWRVVDIYWFPGYVEWWEDGALKFRSTKAVVSDFMYLVLELRVGSWIATPAENELPTSDMLVEYVEIDPVEVKNFSPER